VARAATERQRTRIQALLEELGRFRCNNDTNAALEASPGDADPTRHFLADSGLGWFRIERTGQIATFGISVDGQQWHRLDQRTVDLTNPVYLGLAVSNAVPDDPREAISADIDAQRLESE